MRAMRSIHKAGVRHNDIRAFNLLVKDDGEVTIIDFDRATLGASRGARQRERRHLATFFEDGDYNSYGLPSDKTPQDFVASVSDGPGDQPPEPEPELARGDAKGNHNLAAAWRALAESRGERGSVSSDYPSTQFSAAPGLAKFVGGRYSDLE